MLVVRATLQRRDRDVAAPPPRCAQRPRDPTEGGRDRRRRVSAPALVNRPPEVDALQGVTNEILPFPTRSCALGAPAAEVRTPRLHTIDNDDRRWWWAAALLLLALEAWMRRVRPPRTPDEADATSQRRHVSPDRRLVAGVIDSASRRSQPARSGRSLRDRRVDPPRWRSQRRLASASVGARLAAAVRLPGSGWPSPRSCCAAAAGAEPSCTLEQTEPKISAIFFVHHKRAVVSHLTTAPSVRVRVFTSMPRLSLARLILQVSPSALISRLAALACGSWGGGCGGSYCEAPTFFHWSPPQSLPYRRGPSRRCLAGVLRVSVTIEPPAYCDCTAGALKIRSDTGD